MLRRRAASDIAHDLATPATVLESQLQAMVDGVVPATARTSRRRARPRRRSGASWPRSTTWRGPRRRRSRPSPAGRPVRRGPRRRSASTGCAASGRSASRSRVPARCVGRDPGHLSRALRNVVANAIAHSPVGGASRCRRGSRGGPGRARCATVAIRVTDHGPGIAPDDVPHVFERFYRADPSRAWTPRPAGATGRGLGLTIARELLAANGGRIDVERDRADGTTFLIEVPEGLGALALRVGVVHRREDRRLGLLDRRQERLPGDQPRPAAVGHERPGPADEHDHDPVREADQVDDVDPEPEQPRR